jgi:hypothetical protein
MEITEIIGDYRDIYVIVMNRRNHFGGWWGSGDAPVTGVDSFTSPPD